MTLHLLTRVEDIEDLYQDQCKPGLEERTVEPPARTDVPASFYTAQPIDDRCSPMPPHFIADAVLDVVSSFGARALLSR